MRKRRHERSGRRWRQRSRMAQLIQSCADLGKRWSHLWVELPRVLHDGVDVTWAAFGCLHSIAPFHMHQNVSKRLSQEKKHSLVSLPQYYYRSMKSMMDGPHDTTNSEGRFCHPGFMLCMNPPRAIFKKGSPKPLFIYLLLL